jgi:hypothetical protein
MSVVAALVGNNVQTLTAVVNPTYAFGSRNGAGTCFTSTVTAVPTGGLSPYTYSWAKVSGDTFTIGSATSASTSFNITVSFGDYLSAVYRCTVTSADGQVVTADADVTAMEVSYV